MNNHNAGVSLAFCLMISFCGNADAQDKGQPPAPASASCSRNNALAIIQQQIDATKTFDDDVPRITIVLRAADLIWPYQQERARAAFADAFELATRNFKEKGDEPSREGKVLISTPDQRYVVISVIAKHDAAWAKKLTDQLLKEQRQEAEEKPAKDSQRDITTEERLLAVASSLLSSDKVAALSFARSSLRYPATFYLSEFFYQLARVDKPAADQIYQEALAAYASAPMERLLYLSSYPFGNDREAGEIPGYFYEVPSGFQPNPNLQRMFVQTVLRRVQEFNNKPSDSALENRLSEPEQMWLALTRLERQIQQSLPDLASAVEAARGTLYAQLPQNSRREVGQIANPDNAPQRTFDEQVEAAQGDPNVDSRDQQLTSAIIRRWREASLDQVLSAVDKIADSTIRQQLLNWLYFERAQRAIEQQKLDEARKLAARVEELDQRAWLYSRIAEESLKQNADQTQARDMLDEVVAAAAKAPNTLVTARALLGVAYLYTKIDMNRAVAVVAEAVKCINRIEQPDFSRQFVIRRIEGKTFGTYASIVTPGFSPESAFREIGKIDFDGMLYQASNFSDKSLRALTTLAVAEHCLKTEPATPKNKPTTPSRAKP